MASVEDVKAALEAPLDLESHSTRELQWLLGEATEFCSYLPEVEREFHEKLLLAAAKRLRTLDGIPDEHAYSSKKDE